MTKNFSNFTAYYQAHGSYLVFADSVACNYVNTIDPDEQCKYIKSQPECTEGIAYINYVHLYYCTFNETAFHSIIPILLMIILLFFLILLIFELTVSFLYPISSYLCNAWYLNEHLSGLTVLSYAYGTSHVYGAVRFKHSTEVSLHALFGSSQMNLCLVAAVCVFIRPFKIINQYFVRDTFFLIITLAAIGLQMIDELYCLYEIIILVLLYLLFIIYVVIENWYLKKLVHSCDDRLVELHNLPPTTTNEIEIQNLKNQLHRYGDALLSIREAEKYHISHNDEEIEGSMFGLFKESLSPKPEWKKITNKFLKVFFIIRYPIQLILKFIIPYVDNDLPCNGWSKLLNMINLLILPQLVVLIYKHINQLTSIILAGVSLLLVIIVLITTKTNKAPYYHIVFGLAGYIGIVALLFFATAEIIGIMMTLAIAISIDHDLITLFCYSFGYSLGNLITNICFAIKGRNRMVLAGIYGSTLYQLIFGITFLYAVLNYDKKTLCSDVRPGEFGSTTIYFMIVTLGYTVIYVMHTRYQARTTLAVILLTFYIIFVIFMILTNLEVTHQYDTDHSAL